MPKTIPNDPVAGPLLNSDNDVNLLKKMKSTDLEFVVVSVNALFLVFTKDSQKRRIGC